MHVEVAWILVSSGIQVQPQIILDLDYLPDYLFVSFDYGDFNSCMDDAPMIGFCETYKLRKLPSRHRTQIERT